MLLFSGLGSYYSQHLIKKNHHWLIVIGSIAVLLVLTQLFSLTILHQTIGLLTAQKICVSLMILAPISFLMGIPFPIGISHLTTNPEKAIPWAWGVNSYFSVISVPLATIIAVESGYKWVFILAATSYLIALLSAIKQTKLS